MASPSLELQRAIVSAIRAAEDIAPIFDSVPSGARPPYISFGPGGEAVQDAEGRPVTVEVWRQLDIWADGVGTPEALRIAKRVGELLHEQDLPLATCTLVTLRIERQRAVRDPKQGLAHVVLQLVALVEEPV